MIFFWGVLLIILGVLVAMPFAREEMRRKMGPEERKSAPGRFVTLSQGVTHYEWLGPVRGPVAVCVHGLTTPSYVWRGMGRGLALMGYRVLIYDLYGRGYSDRPPGLQNGQFFNTQLAELLEDQGIKDDITLLGYSMGGAIVASFTARHPEKIRHLILIAPAGIAIIRSRLYKFCTRTQIVGEWLMLALFPYLHRKGVNKEKNLPSSVENITTLQKAELKYQGFVAAVLSSLRGILAVPLEDEHRIIHAAGIPVLAVWGRHDDLIPLSAVGKLTEWSRNARQEVVEDAGHGLTYTHTDAVLAAMSDVLRDGLR